MFIGPDNKFKRFCSTPIRHYSRKDQCETDLKLAHRCGIGNKNTLRGIFLVLDDVKFPVLSPHQVHPILEVEQRVSHVKQCSYSYVN